MSTTNIGVENFSQVIKRLMLALNIHKECELAAVLGFKKDTFSARKKRGALPEDKIKLLCAEKHIDFDWAMTGEGSMHRSEVKRGDDKEGGAPLSDRDLHFLIYQAVDEVAEKLGQDEGFISTKDRAYLASELFRIFSKEDARIYVTKENMLEQAVLLWFLMGNRDRINFLLEKMGLTPSDEAYMDVQDLLAWRDLRDQELKK